MTTAPASPVQPDSAAAAAAAAASAKAATQSPADKAEIWYANGAFVILTHIVALGAFLFYTPKWQTVLLAVTSVQLSKYGITMGYHRLWSHRAFKAHWTLRAFLAFCGTLGFQGSIRWWVLRHRLHHRYTDDLIHDPYAATRGFWFSHIGWIFEKPKYTRIKWIDAKDLSDDPIVVFQHKHYAALALFFGLILPTLIAYTWDDALGGYLYAGIVARVFTWHVTFAINSFAHWLGDQPYSTEMSARGNFLLALFTGGEGNHNFHHEFPKDYRNGILPGDYDPTKWFIWAASKVGLAWDLHQVPDNEIKKAMINSAESHAAKLRYVNGKADWGPQPQSLPYFSPSDEASITSHLGHNQWTIIDGYVLDLSSFLGKHPGGKKLLEQQFEKDSTKAFYGTMNNHSVSARTYVRMLRVARVIEEEVAAKSEEAPWVGKWNPLLISST
ncbi:hypothetical protein DFJ73DRAFT_783908 [Zopfochytrium polystomum]|nr:hypothetical protein DFJ73DRAFT_783908 [Zopfochytrium polystomum]